MPTLSLAYRCACLACALLLLPAGPAAQAQSGQTGAPLALRPLTPPFDPAEPLGRPVTLQAPAMPLEEALREVGRQAGVVLVFHTDLVAARPAQAVDLAGLPAGTALLQLLAGTGLEALRTADGKVLIRRQDAPDAPARPAPRTEAVPQGQTVRGRVVDRDTRMPLPGANVIVQGTDPLLGTSTDADGRFVLAHVPLGRHDLQVTFIGYEPLLLPAVLVTSGKEVVLDVALEEQVVTGAEVVVVPEARKDRPLNDMAAVSARAFSVEETRRYAGGLDDPARMASAFAGVTGAVGLGDNALIIRGNAPKGVLWRLEGVEIPNPSHFAGLTMAGGGGLTLFSSQLLTDSDFFSGAFPAEYGNALAGVFDMRFRTGNPTQREHTLQASLLGLDAASEGPFVQGKPYTYLFNYRYATLALLMPLLPTDSNVIRYQDLSFKLHLPTRRHGRFAWWGIGGLDGQTMSEEPDSAQWEYEMWDRLHYDLALGVGATGVSHTLPVGRRSYIETTAALTVNRTVLDQQRLDDRLVLQDNLAIHSTTGRAIVDAYLNHKFSARHVNRTGATLQRLFYDYDLQAAPDDVPPLVPVARGRGSSTLLQLYSQSQLDLTARLALHAGLHAQHFALTGHTTAEPRLGLRWQVDGRQALSLGYGLHSQIEDLRIYFIQQPSPAGTRPPNRHLGFARAHHAVAGYDRRLGEALRVKFEAYYQSLFDVPVIPDSAYSLLNWEQDWTFNEALVNGGAGRNYGAELTLERFLQDGFYYLLTGSLFRSRYRGGDGVWRSTRYDQGYAANALLGKEFTLGDRHNLLGINGRVVAMGGRRRSPVDRAASRARQEVVYDDTRAFTVQEPGVVLLDLTFTYRLNRRHFAETWALQVKNVLGAKDTYLDYNFQTDAVAQVHEGYPVPVLSYKIEF